MEIRQRAVSVALAITSGAYQTSLLTYLIQRDMFPSVMKVRPMAPDFGEIAHCTDTLAVDTRRRNHP